MRAIRCDDGVKLLWMSMLQAHVGEKASKTVGGRSTVGCVTAASVLSSYAWSAETSMNEVSQLRKYFLLCDDSTARSVSRKWKICVAYNRSFSLDCWSLPVLVVQLVLEVLSLYEDVGHWSTTKTRLVFRYLRVYKYKLAGKPQHPSWSGSGFQQLSCVALLAYG